MSASNAPRLLFVATLLSALAAGCRRDDQDAPQCKPQPAFALTVRAFDGRPLHADTMIIVNSSWGEESFATASPPASPQAVFCEAASERVACNLWTDGAAMVNVTSGGLAPAKVELKADADECGVVTRSEELVLYPELPEGEEP